MSIFHKIMSKLDRYRIIPDRLTGEDYMHRYYLFMKDRESFPFNVTLHKIVKSDEPIYHDHPWNYMTIVLKGGYWEHTPVFDDYGNVLKDNVCWRGPGSIIKRKASEFHWLEIDEDIGYATTLFFMGQKVREWGFLSDSNTWIHYEDFLSKA